MKTTLWTIAGMAVLFVVGRRAGNEYVSLLGAVLPFLVWAVHLRAKR